MMPALWLKFPDEALFSAAFSGAAKRRLEGIFSAADETAPWRQALARIGFPAPPPHTRLIAWRGDAPYFNWSCMARTVSGGAAYAARAEDGAYRLRLRPGLRALGGLLASQWKTARFLRDLESGPEDLAQSIALGLALQALLLRLGADGAHLAAWLADPARAPARHRKTLRQVQAVQMRRTALSHLWHGLFPAAAPGRESAQESLPPFFWDDAPPAAAPRAAPHRPEGGPWRGMSVCAGRVCGLAVAARPLPAPEALAALRREYNAPLILVFPQARPETTELFAAADAVLFAAGGVLSHACTVARERNLPAITGLGPAFYAAIESDRRLWLEIDGGRGTVSILPSMPGKDGL
jgi:phosphohistidine swiveling domain-containing protein